MRNKYLVIILGVLFAGVIFGMSRVWAHCDTLDGPVIQDARIALEKSDVTPVLKWVKKDVEPELRTAFAKALTDRKTNKETADMVFFETLVRLHRQGEGADFTGLKPAGAVEPIIAESDRAIESGSIESLSAEMSHHLAEGVKERFARVLDKSKHKDESVEAGRDYVEAYVEYIHYIEEVHKAMLRSSESRHK